MNLSASNQELELTQPLVGTDNTILTPAALSFLAELAEKFTPELEELLAARKQRQLEFDQGAVPGFDPDTADIRESVWKVAPIPQRGGRPAHRNYRARDTQNGHQCTELRCAGLHGGF